MPNPEVQQEQIKQILPKPSKELQNLLDKGLKDLNTVYDSFFRKQEENIQEK